MDYGDGMAIKMVEGWIICIIVMIVVLAIANRKDLFPKE